MTKWTLVLGLALCCAGCAFTSRDHELQQARAARELAWAKKTVAQVEKYAASRGPLGAALLNFEPTLGMNETDLKKMGELAEARQIISGGHDDLPEVCFEGQRVEAGGRVAKRYRWCKYSCDPCTGGVAVNLEDGTVNSLQQGIVERE